MILKFLNASLKRRVLLMFLIIGMMLIFDMMIINYYQNDLNHHSKALTIVNRTQSSLVQLSNTAKQIFRQNEFDIKDELLLLSSQISANIEVLINGGAIPKTELTIRPSSITMLVPLMNLQNDWNSARGLLNIIHSAPIKVDSIIIETITKTEFIDSVFQETNHVIERVALVPNPNIKNSLSQFTSYKKLIINQLNEITTLSISNYERQKNSHDTAMWVLLVIKLFIVALFLILMISAVIAPLGRIGHLTKKVASGEDVDIKYNKPDEIGEIVASVKSLGNHLRQASNFVHHIGEGNLDVSLEGLNEEQDKEGSLAQSLISMQDKLKSVSKKDLNRNWSTQGIAKFAEILRSNNNDLQSLGDAILAELIAYTNTNIGCLYVPENKDKTAILKLVAFYAYDTKKHFNDEVSEGEGLIGQVFLEKKTIHLLEIPDDYTHVKSGVGTSIPKSILVVPLKVNDEVYGILEIASLSAYDEEQIEFIEKVAETIAGTIYNVKNAERTKKLLEDSQQLTEQMRAQEEEMRQNMEELSATQEEIDRKESQTTSTIEAFNNAIATIDIDQKGVIGKVNGMFTKTIGISKNSLIGENLMLLVKSEYQESLQAIIDDVLQSTQTSIIDVELTASNQSEFTSMSLNISYINSNQAMVICYPTADSNNNIGVQPMTEIEEELTQNLNMLEVTQQVLDDKLKTLEKAFVYLEIDKQGVIKSYNSKLKTIIAEDDSKIIKQHYVDLLNLNDSMKYQIQQALDENQTYNGIITLEGSNNILLHIEQLNG